MAIAAKASKAVAEKSSAEKSLTIRTHVSALAKVLTIG